MIYTHTIGRIGAKDCRVITGTHGTFMAVDIAVDDYSKGKQITTWVRVKSSKENHIRLAEYLTKGRMVLVEGTLTSSVGAQVLIWNVRTSGVSAVSNAMYSFTHNPKPRSKISV